MGSIHKCKKYLVAKILTPFLVERVSSTNPEHTDRNKKWIFTNHNILNFKYQFG